MKRAVSQENFVPRPHIKVNLLLHQWSSQQLHVETIAVFLDVGV